MIPDFLVEAPSVVLRKFRPDDTAKVFRMSSEDGVRTWMPSEVYRDESHVAEVLARLIKLYEVDADPSTNPIVLGVELKGTGELIGHVSLSPLRDLVEIGFAIETARQRNGFATEAVKATCDWALLAYPIRRIHGVSAKHNIASQRTLQRAGFSRQKEEMMLMQGVEQMVVFFVYPGEPCVQNR